METKTQHALNTLFSKEPGLKLAYLFGSRAEGLADEGSDYDFAVYYDGISKEEMASQYLSLLGSISSLLKTDDVDLVVLNNTENALLAYEIVSKGELLFYEEPYEVNIPPKIFNMYFDHKMMLQRNGLTKDSS